jgi:glyoxylase-like metal-dependent hydrolase (beta-lactamase superfamily II)
MPEDTGREAKITKLSLGEWGTNCYTLECPETRESIIIDPSAEADKIMKAVEGSNVRQILLTHGHGDHTQALEGVKSATGAPIGIHAADADMIPQTPDFSLSDGQVISFGNQSLEVIFTPGHTPGSVCLLLGRHLISGDTLFPGGPGASRTPEALAEIINSLNERLFTLPDNTPFYPGHGDNGVLGQEKKACANFIGRQGGRLPPDLCGDVLWESA